jgi:hypothetical protein
VEHKEYRFVFFCVVLLLDIRLVLGEKLGVELDIAGLVDAVNITKTGGDAEVGRDLGESGPDVVDIFWLGIERIVVDILVIDTVFFATGDTNFLSHQINPGA